MNIDDNIVEKLASYDGHIGDYHKAAELLDSLLHKDAKRVIYYIQNGPEKCHTGALYYLRFDCGYEAWAFNAEDGNSQNYQYRKNIHDNWTVIIPKHKRDSKAEMKIIEQ